MLLARVQMNSQAQSAAAWLTDNSTLSAYLPILVVDLNGCVTVATAQAVDLVDDEIDLPRFDIGKQ